MNLLITICARSGSKGVKNKNIRKLNQFPLLYYTLSVVEIFRRENIEKFSNIDLAINTDSEKLIEQFANTKVTGVYIPRKDELSGDFVGKMEVIRDTLLEMEKQRKIIYDLILDLDLTSPIRTPFDIQGTLQTILSYEKADVSFSVTDSRRSPYFNIVCKKKNGFYDKVIPSEYVSRQQAPQCYDMNASIYVYRRVYLLQFEKNICRNSVIWKMKDTGILDIDSEEDYELIQLIAGYLFEKEEYQCIEDGIKKYVVK